MPVNPHTKKMHQSISALPLLIMISADEIREQHR